MPWLLRVLIGVTCLVTLFGIASARALLSPPQPDREQYSPWSRDVTAALNDLGDLPPPSGLADGVPRVGTCSSDDLEIFAPEATMTWSVADRSVADSQASIDELVQGMVAAGWELGSDDQTVLTRQTEGDRSLVAHFEVDPTELILYLDEVSAAPMCSRDWIPFV